MRIGNLELDSNLMLAPLAGYTNLPFRLVIRRLGGLGLATTDLVNARSLLEQKTKAFKLIETCPEDRPLCIQLFGSVPEEMRDAAVYAASLGVSAIDVNMGCPVPKVCKTGGGSAMMTDLTKTTALARSMVNAVTIPVTAKMRLGWDDQNITAPDLARALEDVGIAAITVHGRTRNQGFSGSVNLAGIREVVQAVRHIPVIGNGDVTSPELAKRMLEVTGCQGVSIGRGAFYHPWIFQQIRHYLATGHLMPEPGLEQRLKVMRQHLDLMIEVFGEKRGCQMFRKIAPMYAHRLGPAREFNRRIVQLNHRAEFEEILSGFLAWRRQFLDEHGELKPPYRPAPLACDSKSAPSQSSAELAVRVPRGPTEYW